MPQIRGRKHSSSLRKVLWCAEQAGVGYPRLRERFAAQRAAPT